MEASAGEEFVVHLRLPASLLCFAPRRSSSLHTHSMPERALCYAKKKRKKKSQKARRPPPTACFLRPNFLRAIDRDTQERDFEIAKKGEKNNSYLPSHTKLRPVL